jgi:serine/threonine protein kinase
MSLSIDKDSAEQGENARAVLASWLDDYIAGRCDRADMQAQFLAVCRSNAEAPWDALALLDQYQRRGRIDLALARSLKSDIAQLVFGVANQTETKDDEAVADTTDVTIDTTGSRWRSLIADRDPESINSEPAVVDPTRRLEPEPARHHGLDDDTTAFRRRDDVPPALRRPPDEDATNFRRREEDALGLRRQADQPLTRPPASKLADDEPVVARDRRQEPPSAAHLHALASESPARPSVPPPGLTSDVLRDRYELISILGRGSSGTVYKALDRHRAHLNPAARCVAVKVLKLNYKDRPDELAQLEREFHEAQSLSHPNVVRVFDLDRDGDVYFIVMELLEGELLADILKRLDGQPMARDHALAIISSVGAALAHAHRRNIVHADLKPRNIMITSAGEVRVLDFGFARERPLDLHSASGLSEGPVSAPAYASVERVNGSDPHPSDDVYSLACIAYELLSGRHPFGGRSAPLAKAHGRQPQRIPGLTSRQHTVLQRALLWTRGERRIDVVEFLEGLGCGTAPLRMGLPAELAVPVKKRSRWQRPALAAMLAVALLTGGYYVWQYGLLPKSLSSAPPVMPPVADRERQTEVPGSSVIPERTAERDDGIGSPPLQSITPPAVEPLPGPQPSAGSDDPAASGQSPAAQSRADAQQSAQTVVPIPPPIREQPGDPTVRASATPSAAGAAGSSQPATSTPVRPVVIEFEKDSYVTSEGDGSVRLIVRRTGSMRREVTFTWNLRSNSAEMGSDFAGIGPGTERIPPGVREVGITVPLVQDSIKETTELFLVELQVEGDGVVLGERSTAAVIIVDDD